MKKSIDFLHDIKNDSAHLNVRTIAIMCFLAAIAFAVMALVNVAVGSYRMAVVNSSLVVVIAVIFAVYYKVKSPIAIIKNAVSSLTHGTIP
ncbi:MAG: hypothetical protein LIO69_05445, partial [Oscillospiraceae bacterium]|nr:hypothetical protein [Oscillospiraceae bacterium]